MHTGAWRPARPGAHTTALDGSVASGLAAAGGAVVGSTAGVAVPPAAPPEAGRHGAGAAPGESFLRQRLQSAGGGWGAAMD
jgi:hypothetical protein